ncbi:hypothetical protein LEN26_008576 [Aphanomyces euteiches]|nr:hypothetical protein AeMF1_003637 [Aphanomyces euteiches]KAH9130388.1 hypothetical protein LEN26_008576 [Aphanomyces euteiches]KAH9182786.1 hypothetical protein AeNC1_015236 [Aphanomyces euteiches]
MSAAYVQKTAMMDPYARVHSIHNMPQQAMDSKQRLQGGGPPAPMKREWRGTCRYKSGRCSNERTLKFNGEIHTMCEEHRIRHNNNQRRSDLKRRIKKSPELGNYKPTSMPVSSPLGSPISQTSEPTMSSPRVVHMYSPLSLSNTTPCVKQEPQFTMGPVVDDNWEMDYDIRPATTTMELTDQEAKILYCILGMESEESML